MFCLKKKEKKESVCKRFQNSENIQLFSYILFNMYVCVYIYKPMLQYTCVWDRASWQSQFSPATMQVSEIKLKSSGWVVSEFN